MLDPKDFLLQSQNMDGGWGYRKGGMSFVEPTAAVMLALRDDSARNRARNFLLSMQHADGGWGIGTVDHESGWMTAWAILGLNDPSDAVLRGVDWLRATQGFQIADEKNRAQIQSIYKIDSALRAWSWQPGDASWVHPTALAILALCAIGKRDDDRVREGVSYLYDRALKSGGWNVGNPEMLGKTIPATIQDTAVALLALHAVGENANQPRIVQAFDFLKNAIDKAQTPSELAYGIWAMRRFAWRLEIRDWVARLNSLQLADGSWQGNPFITAIAVIANNGGTQ